MKMTWIALELLTAAAFWANRAAGLRSGLCWCCCCSCRRARCAAAAVELWWFWSASCSLFCLIRLIFPRISKSAFIWAGAWKYLHVVLVHRSWRQTLKDNSFLNIKKYNTNTILFMFNSANSKYIWIYVRLKTVNLQLPLLLFCFYSIKNYLWEGCFLV